MSGVDRSPAGGEAGRPEGADGPARGASGRASADGYAVGVMRMEVEGRDSERFRRRVEAATAVVDRELSEALGVRVDLLSFEGPHLTPAAGAYAPLDFLQIGLAEKLERRVHFLLIVTEVDLSASTLSYTLALPSQLTNVAVASTKRLDPAFWGDDTGDAEADEALAVRRLATLLLHSFGHLLNLSHSAEPENAMHDFAGLALGSTGCAAFPRPSARPCGGRSRARPTSGRAGRAGRGATPGSCSRRSAATGGASRRPWPAPTRSAW